MSRYRFVVAFRTCPSLGPSGVAAAASFPFAAQQLRCCMCRSAVAGAASGVPYCLDLKSQADDASAQSLCGIAPIVFCNPSSHSERSLSSPKGS